MCGNYDQMCEDARLLFLKYDQERIIRKFDLKTDADYLYIRFLNEEYRVGRRDGRVTRAVDGKRAGHNETMSVYDMLCYSYEQPELPALAGEWASLSVLGGIIGAGHTQKLHTHKILAPLEGRLADIGAACEEMGGRPVKGGDVSYILPVFDFFPLWFQFWDADDEFPSSIQFLWDKNAMEFMHYETLWYVVGHIESRLDAYMAEHPA